MVIKYPRTPHLRDIPNSDLIGKKLIVEEKMDGSQAGIRFDSSGELVLFSRGHKLDGSHMGEFQFDLFKQWANAKKYQLYDLLGDTRIMYGEWLHCLHSVYYDRLPHFFLEYDIYDVSTGTWLSTPRRLESLSGAGIHSVKVVDEIDVTEKNIECRQ